MCACVRVCVCVCVCVCVYTLSLWRLPPCSRCLIHTWGVGINDVMLWVSFEVLLPSSFIFISENVIPVVTRHRFNVYKTFYTTPPASYRRLIDVETTSYVYWDISPPKTKVQLGENWRENDMVYWQPTKRWYILIQDISRSLPKANKLRKDTKVKDGTII